ncbi:RHOMBOID-like protein 12, mitochondrial isoform X1 [Apium graveolens]|uniref:RHOMBOID-like protein 12, mitochondrial isoform X1 n=1 Tax=Apium graveolens TaxID=4045 RepID=UPI003D7BF262
MFIVLSDIWLDNEDISLDNLKSGRLHTLVTSAFSHMDGGHLISNMIGLYIFGKRNPRPLPYLAEKIFKNYDVSLEV